MRFAPGKVVTRQGDDGDCPYQIAEGDEEVVRSPQGRDRETEAASLGPPEVLGEMTLFTPAREEAPQPWRQVKQIYSKLKEQTSRPSPEQMQNCQKSHRQ